VGRCAAGQSKPHPLVSPDSRHTYSLPHSSKCINVQGVSACCSPGVPCANITGQCSGSTDPQPVCAGFSSFCCPANTVCTGYGASQAVECSTRGDLPVAPEAPVPTSTSTSTTPKPTPTPAGSRILNNDPSIKYQPANAWGDTSAPKCADSGSVRRTTTVGASFSLQYTGGIALRTIGSTQGGVYSVSVNGGPEQLFDSYAPTNTASCGFTFNSQTLQALFPILANTDSANNITAKFHGGSPYSTNNDSSGLSLDSITTTPYYKPSNAVKIIPATNALIYVSLLLVSMTFVHLV